MPITPVKRMHRVERGKDTQVFQAIDLVLSNGLAMDENRPAILPTLRGSSNLYRVDKLFDSRIAISMCQNLPVFLKGFRDVLISLLITESWVSAIALWLAARWFEIRLR